MATTPKLLFCVHIWIQFDPTDQCEDCTIVYSNNSHDTLISRDGTIKMDQTTYLISLLLMYTVAFGV